MKKFLKISGISIFVILIALIIAPFFLKGKVIKILKKETNEQLNAKVDFDENISISLLRSFPKLSVSINKLSVLGIGNFDLDTLVYLPNVRINLDIMNIIKEEKVKVKGLFLDHPFINLKVTKDNIANWDIAKKDTLIQTDSSASFSFSLENVVIENGRFIYEDLTMPYYIEAKELNLKATGDMEAENFTLKAKMDAEKLDMAYGGISFLNNIKTVVSLVLDMDMKNMRFVFKEGVAKLNDLDLKSDGFVQINENDMDFDLKFVCPQTDFKNILSLIPALYAKDFKTIDTKGNMNFDGFMKGKMTDNTYPAFGFNLGVANGYFKYPSLPSAISAIFLKLNIDNKDGMPDHTVINLSKFAANALNEPIAANLLVKTPVSDPYLKGKLKGKINLANLSKIYPVGKDEEYMGEIAADLAFETFMSAIESAHYEKVKTEGVLNAKNMRIKNSAIPELLNIANLAMNFTPKNVNVSAFEGSIGKSDFKILGSVSNFIPYIFANQTLKGNMDINSNYFNVNPFMTDALVDEKINPNAADTAALQLIDLPGNIDFDLNADFKQLVYDNLLLENLKGNMHLAEKKLHFNNVTSNLLGGTLNISEGSYDAANPKNPFTGLDLKMSNFDIMKSFAYFDFIKKLSPIAQYVNGLFSLDFKMGTNLNHDFSPKYSTFNGEGKISISNAVVKGLSSLNKIGELLKLEKIKTLNIKDIAIKFKIENGNFALLDSLILPIYKGAKLKLTGSSTLDRQISYFARLDIPRADFGEANTALNNLISKTKAKGINIDITEIVPIDALIKGSFTNPEVIIDLRSAKSALVDNLKNQIKDEANKKLDEGKELINAKIDAEKERAKQRALDSIAAAKAKAKEKADQIIADAENRANIIRADVRKNAAETKAKVYAEADAQVAKVNGPIEKALAKKAADKLKAEADKKEQQTNSEGDRRADDIINKAREQAAKIEN